MSSSEEKRDERRRKILAQGANRMAKITGRPSETDGDESPIFQESSLPTKEESVTPTSSTSSSVLNKLPSANKSTETRPFTGQRSMKRQFGEKVLWIPVLRLLYFLSLGIWAMFQVYRMIEKFNFEQKASYTCRHLLFDGRDIIETTPDFPNLPWLSWFFAAEITWQAMKSGMLFATNRQTDASAGPGNTTLAQTSQDPVSNIMQKLQSGSFMNNILPDHLKNGIESAKSLLKGIKFLWSIFEDFSIFVVAFLFTGLLI